MTHTSKPEHCPGAGLRARSQNDQTLAHFRVSGKAQVAGNGFPRSLEEKFPDLNELLIEKLFGEEGISSVTDGEADPAFPPR
jgi:hypothetical protein